jgi:hypothetical protein
LGSEAVLKREGAVGLLGMLQEIGLLNRVNFEGWARGGPGYESLEPFIQGSPEKRSQATAHFLEWVREQQLEPVEASFRAAGVRGPRALQVTASSDPELERLYQTHYVSPELGERKTERMRQKLNKAPELAVFQLSSDVAPCQECATEILCGDIMALENELPLCLSCADLDHLEFLARGDATLTRRARKHSPLAAVVLRFNRSRKRYDRIGMLVTSEAVQRAASECAADASERAGRRVKYEVIRRQQDERLVEEMTGVIQARYPGCPREEAQRIAAHTAQRGSGRVGRTAAAKSLDQRAIELAVIAWVRHQHTNYDKLLMQGMERLEARRSIQRRLLDFLATWQ